MSAGLIGCRSIEVVTFCELIRTQDLLLFSSKEVDGLSQRIDSFLILKAHRLCNYVRAVFR
jgi:hypothetical protein